MWDKQCNLKIIAVNNYSQLEEMLKIKVLPPMCVCWGRQERVGERYAVAYN